MMLRLTMNRPPVASQPYNCPCGASSARKSVSPAGILPVARELGDVGVLAVEGRHPDEARGQSSRRALGVYLDSRTDMRA